MSFVEELVIEARKYHPDYGPLSFSNHLPMTLVALEKLGATVAELQTFYDAYGQQLEPKAEAPDKPIEPSWPPKAGQFSFEAYEQFFDGEVASHGTAATIDAFVPKLADGVGSAAFHALIRLAYAIELGLDTEISSALAYFAYSNVVLQPAEVSKADLQPLDKVVSGLAEHKASTGFRGHIEAMNSKNTIEAMSYISSIPESNERCLSAAIPTDPQEAIEQLAEVAADIYVTSRDFAALHLVTGTHALRVLADALKPDTISDLIKAYTHAFLAMYLTFEDDAVPADRDAAEQHNVDSDELVAAALTSFEPHTVKLVYSATEEFNHYGNDIYHKIAAMRVFEPVVQ